MQLFRRWNGKEKKVKTNDDTDIVLSAKQQEPALLISPIKRRIVQKNGPAVNGNSAITNALQKSIPPLIKSGPSLTATQTPTRIVLKDSAVFTSDLTYPPNYQLTRVPSDHLSKSDTPLDTVCGIPSDPSAETVCHTVNESPPETLGDTSIAPPPQTPTDYQQPVKTASELIAELTEELDMELAKVCLKEDSVVDSILLEDSASVSVPVSLEDSVLDSVSLLQEESDIMDSHSVQYPNDVTDPTLNTTSVTETIRDAPFPGSEPKTSEKTELVVTDDMSREREKGMA